MESSTPAASTLPGSGLRDSGTMNSTSSAPTATIGTLIRKTEPHQKWSSSRPPSTGPMANPAPTAAAQMAMARPRSRGSNTFEMMDSVCGMTAAPPKPIAARAEISWSGVCAYAESSEATPKSTKPMMSIRLRPILSPITPNVNSSPANISV